MWKGNHTQAVEREPSVLDQGGDPSMLTTRSTSELLDKPERKSNLVFGNELSRHSTIVVPQDILTSRQCRRPQHLLFLNNAYSAQVSCRPSN